VNLAAIARKSDWFPPTPSKSKPKSHCNKWTVSQCALVSNPAWDSRPDVCYSLRVFKHNRSCRWQCKSRIIPGTSLIYIHTYINTVWQLLFCPFGAPVIICGRKAAVSMHISIYILHFITWYDISQYMQYIQASFSLCSVQHCPIKRILCHNGSVVTC
jgi:hypothetical protein